MNARKSAIDLIYEAVPPLSTDEEAHNHIRLVLTSIVDREDVSEVSISLTIDGRPFTCVATNIRDKT